ERSPPGTTDLVRRQGSFGSQPRRILHLAGPEEIQANWLGGHGYVEGVSQIDPQERPRATGENSVRQVSRGGSPSEGDGPGPQERICPLEGQGPTIHQRALIPVV